MHTPTLLIALTMTIMQSISSSATATDDRWPAEKAWEWYNRQPWLVGCNFVPSTACNDVEMWQKETFDPETMDRELGWAADLGFNTVRVFLNYAVWEADPEGLKERFGRFLQLAEKHGIRVMPILFDDCFNPEPKVGKQPDPVPGVHNSQWVQSPGAGRRGDRTTWPMLEKYVKDMVGTFGQDKRIVIWDLYNEPMVANSLPLVQSTFAWARAARPSQPLASCWMAEPYSDLINIHNYGPVPGLKKEIEEKRKASGRPVICSEWMARVTESCFQTHLPLFKKEKVACWNWGLVAGRTQTYFAWGSPKGAPEPKAWLHDIFRKDGTPYDANEAKFIKEVTGKNRALLDGKPYRGWKSVELTNGLVGVNVVAEIGGRVIQYRLGTKEFFWVNPQLAGKLPPPSGLGPGGTWINWGGDKLWPAPQGWDNADQWPGPPDAVLDGLPHQLQVVNEKGPRIAVRLTSGKGSPSGVQFARVLSVSPGSSRVSIETTMTNVDTKPRRWGTWTNTQLDATGPGGKGHNPLVAAYCPINPKSRYPDGYKVLFGAEDNPSFQRDRERKLAVLKYQYKVGKIALDSSAGWAATVNGVDGSVFVQRFTFEPQKEYPDGASVEFWSSGLGKIHAWHKDIEMPNDPVETPPLIESEILSPFAKLEPGQSYTWRYDWYAANLGGNYPVVDCSEVGLVGEPLQVAEAADGKLELNGRFGVFYPGTIQAALLGPEDKVLATADLGLGVSPFTAAVLSKDKIARAAGARVVALQLVGLDGKVRGELARAALKGIETRWKFSSDQGKTYTVDSLPSLASGGKLPVWGRAEFTIDDPAKLGALWFGTEDPEGGVCPVNERQIGPRYVGMPHVLLDARVTVDGKAVEPEMNDMLYKRLAIDPRLLKPGANVLSFRGTCWNALSNLKIGTESPLEFRLAASSADALELKSGPVLGPIGEDYFTLACRTYIPCEIEVKVKPTEPAGPEKTERFARGTIHRARLALPKGTRRFQYSITAVNGPHKRATGPWEVRVPDPSKGLRFVVLGQTAAGGGTDGLVRAAESLRKVDPDFIIHTGSIVLMAYWDFAWDDCLFQPWKDLLARTPMCVVPAYRDLYSQAFARLLYHPTANGDWQNWTWTVGNVRLIGSDGWTSAHRPEATARWLEEILKAANEDYVFFVSSYPAFTTNPFGRGMKGHEFEKTTVHPLLAKYRATANLGCTGKYEYIPPPNPQSVPSLITGGVGAPMAPGWNKYQYCVFLVKDGKCEVEAIAYETGEVLDRKTFTPRQR